MLDRLPDDPAWGHGHVAGSGEVMLHYVRLGVGDPVLLLHGWPGFWYDWRRVLEPLSGFADVIAPDFRGFGESDKPDLPPAEGYTPETWRRTWSPSSMGWGSPGWWWWATTSGPPSPRPWLVVMPTASGRWPCSIRSTQASTTVRSICAARVLVPAFPRPGLVRSAHRPRPGDRAPVSRSTSTTTGAAGRRRSASASSSRLSMSTRGPERSGRASPTTVLARPKDCPNRAPHLRSSSIRQVGPPLRRGDPPGGRRGDLPHLPRPSETAILNR
jgi:hypothetical protein